MSAEVIKNSEDVLLMLDSLMREPAPFWDQFYQDRTKKVPFFVEHPDENLVSHVASGLLQGGRMLELGCGPGRNAVYAALHGYEVDAVDISEEAIAWAKERAAEQQVRIQFECMSVYDLHVAEQAYDLVYDSGCLHQLWPHRRVGYLRMIQDALKPGGYFGMTCFAPGFTEMGGALDRSDWEVYRERSMKGGQAYSKEKLIEIMGDAFQLIEFRAMKECDASEGKFGVPFLWVSLWQKRGLTE